jgi:hypothetical protein
VKRTRVVPALPRSFPAPLVDVVARMTDPDPGRRFATAAALRNALLDVPDHPRDPARALATLLADSKDAPGIESDALLEAVLGGAGPLTVRPMAPLLTPAPSSAPRRRPRWPWAVAAAALASLTAIVLVARHGDQRPLVIASEPVLVSPPEPEPEPQPDRPRPRRGTLSINAVPWARVFLDDRALGQTPRQRIAVEAGRHRLRLVTAKGDVRSQLVEIAPNKETLVSVDFSRP